MKDSINIGQEIREELRRMERSVTWFSRQLGINRVHCYRIFNNYSIDTGLLQRICEILHRDFFKLYSKALESDEAEAVPPPPRTRKRLKTVVYAIKNRTIFVTLP